MNKRFKPISLILSVIMVLSLGVTTAFAQSDFAAEITAPEKTTIDVDEELTIEGSVICDEEDQGDITVKWYVLGTGAQKVAADDGSITIKGVKAGKAIVKLNATNEVTGDVVSANIEISVAPCAQDAHIWGDWKVTTPATCIAKGEEQRECEKCGATETRETDFAKHVFTSYVVETEPTCTEAGLAVAKCDTEGCEVTDEKVLPALDHVWIDAQVTKEPTCTEEGEQTATCDICGETKTEAIPSLGGHKVLNWTQVKAPTCTEAGRESGICEVCKNTISRDIEPTGHDFAEWRVSKEATCTQEGEEFRICQKCGEKETQAIPVKEHTVDMWTVTTPATCTEDGVEKGHCSVCDSDVERVVPAKGHDEASLTKVEATCEKEGRVFGICSVCGVFVNEEIPATGHNFGEWQVRTEATCTQEGEEFRTCANCDKEETRVIPAAGHKLSAWTIITPATCTQKGEAQRECTVCDDASSIETRVIPAKGHSVEKWEVTKEATCKEAGVKEGICTVCNEKIVEEIPMLEEHTFGEWETVTPATCTQDGEETRKCEICDEVETQVIPATGHSFEAFVVDVKPSYSADGSGHMNCKNCDYVYTNVITKYTLGDVENFTAQTASYKTIKLSWDKVDGADGYIIYRSTSKDSGFKRLKTIKDPSITSVINKQDVKMGVRYYYKAVPFVTEASGRFIGNETAVSSAVAKIGAVTDFTAQNNDGAIKLSWNKATDADGYIIYRSETAVGGYVRHVTLTSGSRTSVNITKYIEVGKEYYFKIKPYKVIDGKKCSTGVYGPVSAVA